jgi:peptidase E
MEPTALVYSSHDRCNYIHNDWIVQRALRGNRRILFLPMSEGRGDDDGLDRQEYSYGKFEWFFNFYRPFGLEPICFYWRAGMRREDVDALFQMIEDSEVVLLGGGNPGRGLQRYRSLGEWYYGDAGLFARALHERQDRGKLTVGFSAGVDQLCEYMTEAIDSDTPDESRAFGLCRNVISQSHFEHGGMEDQLRRGAMRFGHCLCFALPNDSGLAVDQGHTPGGNIWQHVQFITDQSWDLPQEAFHIKTRSGVKIQHYLADGRHWAFSGGDAMLRVQSWDCHYSEAWISMPGAPIIEYWNQHPTGWESFEQIVANR